MSQTVLALKTVAALLEDAPAPTVVPAAPQGTLAERTVAALLDEGTPVLDAEEPDVDDEAEPAAEEPKTLSPEQAKMVQDNDKLWWHIARSFASTIDMDVEDIYSEAKRAAIRAALAWDPANGTPYAKFAANGVRLHLRYIHRKEGRYGERQQTTLFRTSGGGSEADVSPREAFAAGEEDGSDADERNPLLRDTRQDTRQGILNQERRDLLIKLVSSVEDPMERELLTDMLNGDEIGYKGFLQKYGVSKTELYARRARALATLRDKLKALGFNSATEAEADAMLESPMWDNISDVIRLLQHAPDEVVRTARRRLLGEGKFELFKKGHGKKETGKPPIAGSGAPDDKTKGKGKKKKEDDDKGKPPWLRKKK